MHITAYSYQSLTPLPFDEIAFQYWMLKASSGRCGAIEMPWMPVLKGATSDAVRYRWQDGQEQTCYHIRNNDMYIYIYIRLPIRG